MASGEHDIDRIVQGTLFGEAALTAELATLLADEDGQYIAVNDEAVRLTGYTRSELTGYRMGSLGADEQSRAIFQQINRRKKLQGRKLIKLRDGELLQCRYWAIPAQVTKIPYFLLFLWPATQR
jgi:PAS domain S-box-containing protein